MPDNSEHQIKILKDQVSELTRALNEARAQLGLPAVQLSKTAQ